MKTLTLRASWVGALAAAGAALLFQGNASAQYSQCAADADCGPGFVCKTETYESCSGGWSCDDDGECTMLPGECETYEQSWCANATCAADADCPSYMACQAQSSWTCDGDGGSPMGGTGGTAGTGIGGAGGAGECTEVPAESLCIFRHHLPCEAASDCGGGFDCVESSYWECSGGGEAGTGAGGVGGGVGGVGGAGGFGMGGAGEPTECHEVPSGVSYCNLQDLPCETNADCFEGLRCEEQYVYQPCEMTGAGTGAGGSAGTFAGGAGGAGGAPGGDDGGEWYCPEPEVVNRCVPLSHLGGGGMGGVGGFGGGPVGGTGGVGGGAGLGGSGGGFAGASGMNGGEDPGQGNAGTGAGAGGATEDDEHPRHHGRGRGLLRKLLGCSTSGPIDTGNSAVGFMMLGLAAIALTRRTRR
jgi:hypothetical protein